MLLTKIFKKKQPIHIKIAYIISRLLDPVLWLVPMGVLVIYYSEPTGQAQWLWLLGFVLFLAILPAALILSKLKKKKISDIDLSKRQERTPVYITLIILWGAGLVTLRFIQTPQLIFVSLLSGEIIVIMIFLINLKWKISNHALVMSIVSVFSVTIISIKWWWFFLTIPVVAWSRVVQKRHTPLQVIVGALLGIVFYFVLKGFGY